MVTTRSQSGALDRQKYDLKTLEQNSVTRSNPAASGSSKVQKARGKTRKSGKRGAKGASKKGKKIRSEPSQQSSDDDDQEVEESVTQTEDYELLENTFPEIDLTEGVPNFFPKSIIGAREESGKSNIARAEEQILKWREIREAHEEHYPKILPFIDGRIQEAERARAELEDNEENNRVGSTDPAGDAIAERLAVLREGLRRSKFGPETDNIQAAIDGYQSGAIQYSDKYTIIYAGQIVDQASSYAAFTSDRQARLDRYFEEHGAHWLYYEPPLAIHPEAAPKMAGCVSLGQSGSHWYVTLGVWKRSGWVYRVFGDQDQALPFPMVNGQVSCQSDGPKLGFRTLADTGSTYPTLYKEDFQDLGIDENLYACQSFAVVSTANGPLIYRQYEVFVQVIRDDATVPVDPNDRVYPNHPAYLGGLFPVSEILTARGAVDQNGIVSNHRLSGMVPFECCYVSSTPGSSYLYLGEDRKDVLGIHKMPGQMRYAVNVQRRWNIFNQDQVRDPLVRFNHRQGDLIDEDHLTIPHSSVETSFGATNPAYSNLWRPATQIQGVPIPPAPAGAFRAVGDPAAAAPPAVP
ncbi:hypothetical protein BP5796_06703 [Coleophoma crateriformis]|uniref:Uncharacterized protein n=1 Tax=Coleophoma crateriformis TaxID=565419 RepID=A0A3D8RP66_9HELO|nr:hypothetical protein BP5796_06703 [Coleophoma crateriformis]